MYEYRNFCDGLNVPGNPYDLINKNPTGIWHSKRYEYGWLIFEMPSKQMTITEYSIISITCCTLRNHYLKGSNDGLNWIEITHITSNTQKDNQGKLVKYKVPESTFRMYKIEEEQSDLGSNCGSDRYFGLRKVDFLTTRISNYEIRDNFKGVKVSVICFQSNFFHFLFITSTHSLT